MSQPSDLEGLALVSLLNKTISDIEGHAFPPMQIVNVPNDPDDEDSGNTYYMRCPWHAEDDVEAYDERIIAFDIDLRSSKAEFDGDEEDGSISIFSESPDYGPLLYFIHRTCGKPMDPPTHNDIDWM
jgi:hypothetical protein